MSKRFLACILSLAMLLTTLPAFAAEGETVVATIGENSYTDFYQAVLAAKQGGTITVVADAVVESWPILWYETAVSGLTIEGNNHTLTVNNVPSNGNGAYMFHGSTDMKVSDFTINLPDGATAFDVPNGTFTNVTVNGGKWAFVTGATEKDSENQLLIQNCIFNNQTASAIYTEDTGKGYGLVVDTCTFNGAGRPIQLRANEKFINNTINTTDKLTVAEGAAATITGNTFSADSALKLYSAPATTIEKNTLSKIEASSGVAADLSGNYWGGNEPQNLPEGVMVTTYYTNPEMTETAVTSNVTAKIGDTYYSSVTKALNAANAGEIVEVLNSTAEAIAMPLKSVTLKGVGDVTLTGGIKFAGGEVPEGTAVTIENLTFDGRGVEMTAWTNTKNLKNFASLVIRNNTFKNVEVRNSNSVLQSIYAIHINNGDDAIANLSITDNTFEDNRIGGISIGAACGTAVITGNTITNSGRNAICFAGKDNKSNTATSVTIADNTFSEWGYDPEKGRAMRLSNFADGTAVDLTGNVFTCVNAPEEYIKATGVLPEQLDLNECYWGGNAPTVGTGTGLNIWVVGANNAALPYKATTYYEDAEKTQLAGTENAVAKVGDTYYGDLLTAIKAADENATVTVLQDTELNEDPTAAAFINKSLTIEGNNCTITTDEKRIFRVNNSNVVFTLKNATLTGSNAERALQIDPNCTEVTLNVDNCKMAVTYYAINLCSNTTSSTVNITGSDITGWSVFNIWSNNATITVDDSTLVGNNTFSYDADGNNDFAAVVINQGVTKSTIDITNSTVKAITLQGNYQKILNIQDGDVSNTADPTSPVGNTVTFTGCTFETEGTLHDGTPLQPMYYAKGGNTLVIDGKTMYIPEKTGELEENAEVEINLTPVAKVGDIYFGDLQTAVDAAKAGDTITLVADVTINQRLVIGTEDAEVQPELILNLNGHTLSRDNDMVLQNYGKLTINGTSDDGKVGKIVSARGHAISTWENSTLNVNNTEIDAYYFAVTGNGSTSNVTINLDGVTAISRNGTGIYNPQDGVTNIKNSNITGGSGIEIRAGSVNVENSTISGTDPFLTQNHNSSTTVLGAAIAISQHTTNKPINLTVNGGTFTGEKAIYEHHHVVNATPDAPITIYLQSGTFNGEIESQHVEKFINGGTYKPAADEKYLADGNNWYEQNGYFYVVPAFTMTAVAAPAQVGTGDTVTVTVTASGASSYTNADWKLRYDPTKLSYVGAELLEGAVGKHENYVLSGEIKKIGASTNDEIASGTILATYTFTAVGQSTSPVTTTLEVLDAHVNTYDMAVQLGSVPAKTENTAVEIIIDETNTVKGTLAAQTIPYDGKAHMANAFVPTAGMTGATVTYSATGAEPFTTEIPSFTQVGSHDVWYRAALTGYTTTTEKVTGAVVITPKAVTAGVELAAGAVYPAVSIRPVINGLADGTFTGTVTVGIDGQTFTFAAADFVYDGNGKAILTAEKAQTVSLSRGGAFDVTASYTAGESDNYTGGDETTTPINVDLAFADEATVTALTDAITNEFVYTGQPQGVTVAEETLPDGWKFVSATAIDGTANPTVTNVADGSVFVQVVFADENGRYNNVTINTVLTVTPADVTITVGDFAKDFGTDDATILPKEDSTEIDVDGLIAEGDLGDITAVRGELGEERGTYAMTASYTPNSNYNVTVVNGKLEIGAPAYLIEVVDNALLHGGDHNSDYVAGYKLVLVYTDADRSYFTYNNRQMYDVTENGYKYVDYSTGTANESDKEYRHVFGIVVKADGGNAADYRTRVRYTTDAAAQPERIVYDMDVNFDRIYDVNDISAANGVYNALYADVYARNMLKADANADKYVDTKDVELVKARVEK